MNPTDPAFPIHDTAYDIGDSRRTQPGIPIRLHLASLVLPEALRSRVEAAREIAKQADSDAMKLIQALGGQKADEAAQAMEALKAISANVTKGAAQDALTAADALLEAYNQ